MNPLVTTALWVVGLLMLVGCLPLGIALIIAAVVNQRVYNARVETERQRLQKAREEKYDRMLAVGSRAI